jgi:hypothetical protein
LIVRESVIVASKVLSRASPLKLFRPVVSGQVIF